MRSLPCLCTASLLSLALFAGRAAAADAAPAATNAAGTNAAARVFPRADPGKAPVALPLPAQVSCIKVVPDRAPDCTSLTNIVNSITRGCKSNDDKAIAVYNFMNLTHYHFKGPNQPGGLPVLKEINCYGWSLCGSLHAEESALWRALGWKWRFVGWDGHTTAEAGYDDKWHYLDIFLRFYAWMPDGKGGRTIAGEDDLNKDPTNLIANVCVMDPTRKVVYFKDDPVMKDGKPNVRAIPFLTCGDTVSGTIEGLGTHKVVGPSEGWTDVCHATRNYSADVALAPGMALTCTWDAIADACYWNGTKYIPGHKCRDHKDTRNDPAFGAVLEPYVPTKPRRSWGNGTIQFAPAFANEECLKSFLSADNVKVAGGALKPAAAGKPGVVVVQLSTPYVLTRGTCEAVGADTLEVSTDGGKTFTAMDLPNFTDAIWGWSVAQVRLTFKEALQSLKIEAIFQNNPGSLPYLSPGSNLVTVSVADPRELGNNKLVVTYAYKLGSRSKSLEDLAAAGKELSMGASAKWSDTVTFVQKTFTAKDLPATFEIDCPTPKGEFPVYPRMLFLRREVLPPEGKPLPLPDGAVAATPAKPEELPTLPNPFLYGADVGRLP
jgi:hypothetical protein